MDELKIIGEGDGFLILCLDSLMRHSFKDGEENERAFTKGCRI